MPALIFGIGLILSSICQTPAMAQASAGPGPAFRLIHAKSIETLQQELDRASTEGYAVALAWPEHRLVILKRGDPAAPAVYRVLDGKSAIEQGLAEGYRAVPDTFDVSDGKPLVIAAKAGAGERYESLVIQTNKTGTLDREIRDARAKGYCVIGLASDYDGHGALLERPAGAPSEQVPADAVTLIAAARQETLQKELAEQSAGGYRIAQTSARRETIVALERGGETPVEYRVLSTTKSSTLEREMNAAVSDGFRLAPGTLHAQEKGSIKMFGRMGTDYVAIMEKRHGSGSPLEYSIVGARRASTLIREFDAAVAKGLGPVALAIGYSDQETIVVFERAKVSPMQ